MDLYMREICDYLRNNEPTSNDGRAYGVDEIVEYIEEAIHFSADKNSRKIITQAVDRLVRCRLLEYMDLEQDAIEITQDGYREIHGFEQRSESNQVNIHGAVSQSAFAMDGSKSTVNIHANVAVQNLIEQIQANPDLTHQEKAKWTERFQELSKDPRVLAIFALVCGFLTG